MPDFVAIDFETADYGADSACAIGLAIVRDNHIVERAYRLIRPPRQSMVFSPIHGLTWNDVCDEAPFADVWPELAPLLDGAEHLVAHNARFDRNVLQACCLAAGLPMPQQSFLCTVQMARKMWNLRPTKLNNVCHFLAISLNHHHAGSDASACAEIAVAAFQDGYQPAPPRPRPVLTPSETPQSV
jgi:DNA polymerase-3 subunit epsilon